MRPGSPRRSRLAHRSLRLSPGTPPGTVCHVFMLTRVRLSRNAYDGPATATGAGASGSVHDREDFACVWRAEFTGSWNSPEGGPSGCLGRGTRGAEGHGMAQVVAGTGHH